MKIGYYCESPADQAALKVFTEGILGEPSEPISVSLDALSMPAIFRALDGVIRGLHYNSDAEGLVIVVDCDKSVLHATEHDSVPTSSGDCRWCRLQRIISATRNLLKPRQGLPELKIAIGVPVPAIEAWYLVGKHKQVGEAAWRVGIETGNPPFTTGKLKEIVYGAGARSRHHSAQRAIEESQRVIRNLKEIEASFPMGFGLMAQQIRSWRV